MPASLITFSSQSVQYLPSLWVFSTPLYLSYLGNFVLIFTEQQRSTAYQNGSNLSIQMLTLGLATIFLGFLSLYFWNLSAARQSYRFKQLYYQTLLNQQVAWYDSNDLTKLSTQVTTNISHFQNAIGQKAFLLITTLSSTLFGFVYPFFKCWHLSIVLTLIMPFMVLSGRMIVKSFADIAKIRKTSFEDAAGRVEQALTAIKTVKSLVGEQFQYNEMVKCLDRGKEKNRKLMVSASIGFSIVMANLYVTYAVGFWYAKKLVVNYGYRVDEVLSAFHVFLVGGYLFGQISPIMKNITDGVAAVKALKKLMGRKPSIYQSSCTGNSIERIQSIEFKNVNFSYGQIGLQQNEKEPNPSSSQILSNISIEIPINKVTAIVGESGSGKSTIAQLLLRFYDPTSGSICVNGTSLRDLNAKKWRDKIGYVGQEPVLFAMTIEQNIKLANPNITESQIIECLKTANIWQFVQSLEKGIHTYVGSNGALLSGGQKQRLAIARMIAKNPQFLILDQATSALDRKNQREIQQTIKNLSKAKITTIVIAHRLSTIQQADQILVLSQGKVFEKGNHQSLIQSQGAYFSLVKTELITEQLSNQTSQQFKGQITGRNSQAQAISSTQKQSIKSEPEKIPNQTQMTSLSTVNKILKFNKTNNQTLIVGVIFALLSGATEPLFNFFLGQTFGLFSDPFKNSQKINTDCLLFTFIAILSALFTFLYKFNFQLYGEKIVYSLRKSLFHKLLKLPVSFYDKKQNTPGALSARLSTDADQLHTVITGLFSVIFINLSTVGISLLISLYYSWQLTLVVLFLSPLMIFYRSIQQTLVKNVTLQAQTAERYIGSLISDTVNNIRTVKSVGKSENFILKYEQKLEDLAKVNNSKIIKTSFFDGMGRSISMLVQGVAYFAAGYMYHNNYIEDGSAVYITIFTLVSAAGAIGKNNVYMPDFVKAKIAAQNVFNILEAKDQLEILKEKGMGKNQFDQKALTGPIEFKNETFKYPQRNSHVLRNISCVIENGKKTAIVGVSGSGKSTIAQILLRFYPLESGQVTMNGKNIEEFDLYSYRKSIGYVSQQPFLFNGTVESNISYDKSFTKQQIAKSTEISFANKFIEEWQQKQNKSVGHKGSQISGGQKQRIALARCLIRNRAVYLFDQSTSALDTQTEKIVTDNLVPVTKGKTSVFIAHRMSTVENSDKILVVMKDGKIVEAGTYFQLMALQGYFYNLVKGK